MWENTDQKNCKYGYFSQGAVSEKAEILDDINYDIKFR